MDQNFNYLFQFSAVSYSRVKLCYLLHRSCRSIFGGVFLLQAQIPLSPGMVSNDDTNLCDKSIDGEELFGSDFAIMCISHIAYLFICLCVCVCV